MNPGKDQDKTIPNLIKANQANYLHPSIIQNFNHENQNQFAN